MNLCKAYLLLCAVVILPAVGGCQSPYMRDQLALFGGLTGASIGGALSNGNSAENAAIGAVMGTLAGAVVGDKMDEADARNQALFEQHLGRQLAGATTLEDVIAMSQAGLGDEVICTHISGHGMARKVSTQDLILLKDNGVSDRVIQSTQALPPPAASAPPVVVEERYYARPHRPWFWHHQHRPRRPHHRVNWGFSFIR